MVHDSNPFVRIDHQVGSVVVAMAKHTRNGRELSRDVVELRFQLGDFRMPQSFTAKTPEIVIEEEIQLPRELGLVKRKPARNRLRLVSAVCGLLDFRDESNRLLFVLVALLFRFVVVNLKQLPVAQILLNDDPGLPSTA